MELRAQREGIYAGFHMFPCDSYEGTLGNPERILWTSLRYMCVRDVAAEVLFGTHKIRSLRDIKKVSRNIKIYIEQAHSFYKAAQAAETRTAPLIYYYSFLNLAKALSEIKYPGFHKRPECYHHGITWKISKDYLVNMSTESLNVTTRGVWHTLLEAVTGASVTVHNPLSLLIKELFALCPETGVEFERIFDRPTRLVELIKPGIFIDETKNESWLKITVSKSNLDELRLSRPKLINLIITNCYRYESVRSDSKDTWTFESIPAMGFNVKDNKIPYELVEPLIKSMNLFVNLGFDELEYMIPIQDKLPIKLPQLMVLYSLIFWLGSLVRYDPHSVDDLSESRYWFLIDGYMNQSRIWLLELFEWYFYRTDTTLRSVR